MITIVVIHSCALNIVCPIGVCIGRCCTTAVVVTLELNVLGVNEEYVEMCNTCEFSTSVSSLTWCSACTLGILRNSSCCGYYTQRTEGGFTQRQGTETVKYCVMFPIQAVFDPGLPSVLDISAT